MSLKDKVMDDIKVAMKARDQLSLGVLRMVKARFLEFETSGKDEKVDDAKAIQIIQNMIKQRQESSKAYREGDRLELAEQEEQEAAVLEKYLPDLIPEEQVRSVIDEVVSSSGAQGPGDIGKVMGPVMGKLKAMDGLCDGGLVQKLVKEKLSG